MTMAPQLKAGDWDYSGYAGVETRAFLHRPLSGAQTDRADVSILLQPEFRWRSDDGRKRVSVVGYGRWDSQDDERTHLDLREAYFAFEADGYDLTLGVNTVFWGVAESRHLVDVINQTDLVEDPDGEVKLGQPMINIHWQRDWGRLGLFMLPGFRERSFPGVDGRLRTPVAVIDDPLYESGDEEAHVDWALRYSHYFGDVDVGTYLFDGTSREPRFVLDPSGQRLRPVYDQMSQLGVDLQWTRDAWLWKLEAIARNTAVDDFAAVVFGFEYTRFGIAQSSMDLGLLVEGIYDGRGAESAPTALDRELFLGSRLALNDAADSSLLAGVAIDIDTHEQFFSLEAERRIGSNLRAELRARAFSGNQPNDALYAFRNDDYVELRLRWFY